MKRYLSVILALCMLLCILPAPAYAAPADFTFTFLDDDDQSTVTAGPGDQIKVCVKVDAGNNTCAGMDVQFDTQGIAIDYFEDNSEACGNARLGKKEKEFRANFTSVGPDHEPLKVSNGKDAFTFYITIPSTAKSGDTYTIGFGEVVKVFKEGGTGDRYSTSFTPLTIKVETPPVEVDSWSKLYEALQEGRNIVLTSDVKYGRGGGDHENDDLTLPQGKTVTLDLNGHVIDRGLAGLDPAVNGSVLTSKGTLTLTDSDPTAAHSPAITYTDPIDGTTVRTVTGGVITGGNVSDNSGTGGWGGGVYAWGAFTMSGGTICGNNAGGNGGGVYCYNTFTMSGGAICGNTTGSRGGGVSIASDKMFIMTGGSVTGNKAAISGGGVAIASDGTFNMTGGSITNNKAAGDGGGVNVSTGCTFLMTGGSITDNVADGNDNKDGGGVWVSRNAAIKISGTPRITGNKTGDREINIYLYESNGEYAKISVDGALTGEGDSKASIGVTMASPGIFTDGLSGKGTAANFTSDDGGYVVSLTDAGEAKLGPAAFTVAVTAGANMTKTAASGDASQQVQSGEDMTAVIYTANEGYYFPTDYAVDSVNGVSVTRNSWTQITVSGTPTADAAITLTAPTAKRKITFWAGSDTWAFEENVTRECHKYTIESGSLIGNDAVTEVVFSGSISYPGSVPNEITSVTIMNAGVDVTPSYDVTFLPGTLTVNPLPEVVVSNSSQTVYVNDPIEDMEITVVNATVTSVTGLPAGVSWSGTTISGTPTVTGSFNITVIVTSDQTPSCGTATADVVITVEEFPEYAVMVTAGANMTKTAASGAASQTVDAGGAMTAVIYTANEGYYFPENYAVAAVNGVSVTRNSWTQITVSGTPTANAAIVLTAATAKTKESTPEAVFTATGADCGTLSNVTAAMKYSLDGGQTWLAITAAPADITGVTAENGVKVYLPATDTNTKLDSDEQTIEVTKAAVPEAVFTATGADCGTLTGVTAAMKYSTDGGQTWQAITAATVDITGVTAENGIKVFTPATGADAKLGSDEQTIEVTKAVTPEAVFTATGADCGTLTNVTAAMKYSTDGGQTWLAISAAPTDISGVTAANGVKVYTPATGADATLGSDEQTIEVTKAVVPDSVTGENCKSYENDDGRLIGVTAAMEYKADFENEWKAGTGADIKGLDPGTYLVRVKPSGTALMSEPKEIRIAPFDGEPTDEFTSGTPVPPDEIVALIREGTPLTVDGDNGEKVIIDVEALKELAGPGASVNVTVETNDDGTTVVSVIAGVMPVTVPVKINIPADEGKVLAVVNEDGSITPIAKSVVGDGEACGIITSGTAIKIIDNAKTFYDVPEDAWYSGPVSFVSSRGLFEGTGKGFEPDGYMTRAMLATVLYRLENATAEGLINPFADVPEGAWYEDAAVWAGSLGILEGTDGCFEPNEYVTREQIAVAFFRYANYSGLDVSGRASLDRFFDGFRTSEQARDAMEWAVDAGLFQGDAEGRLDPKGAATRAQVAALFERLVKLILK